MLLIGNGRLITRGAHNRLIENGCVAADGNVIAAVGTTEELKKRYPGAEFIDARGGMILPGLINAHNHIYSAYSRGIAINGYNPQNFLDILDGMWWTIDRNLLLGDTRMQRADHLYRLHQKRRHNRVRPPRELRRDPREPLCDRGRGEGDVGCAPACAMRSSDRDGEEKMRQAVKENADFIALLQKGQDRHGQGHDGPARLLHPLGRDARTSAGRTPPRTRASTSMWPRG